MANILGQIQYDKDAMLGIWYLHNSLVDVNNLFEVHSIFDDTELIDSIFNAILSMSPHSVRGKINSSP